MTKKRLEAVTLKRGGERRRRFPWWVAAILVPLVLIGGGVAWLYQGRIRAVFERPATLPPPPPGQGEGVLYQTGFEDPAVAADWDIFNDGMVSAAISGGQLVVDVNAVSDTGTWSAMNFTYGDFVLDVDATKLAGPDDNGIIVLFRLVDDQNYNRFDISSDGYYSLSKVRSGNNLIVSDYNASPAILTGAATNHIRITAVGNTFRFEVNGTPLLLCTSDDPHVQPIWDVSAEQPSCLGGQIVEQWTDDSLSRGKIGLGAQGFVGFDGQNTTPALATIGFDNLVIRVPEAPAP